MASILRLIPVHPRFRPVLGPLIAIFTILMSAGWATGLPLKANTHGRFGQFCNRVLDKVAELRAGAKPQDRAKKLTDLVEKLDSKIGQDFSVKLQLQIEREYRQLEKDFEGFLRFYGIAIKYKNKKFILSDRTYWHPMSLKDMDAEVIESTLTTSVTEYEIDFANSYQPRYLKQGTAFARYIWAMGRQYRRERGTSGKQLSPLYVALAPSVGLERSALAHHLSRLDADGATSARTVMSITGFLDDMQSWAPTAFIHEHTHERDVRRRHDVHNPASTNFSIYRDRSVSLDEIFGYLKNVRMEKYRYLNKQDVDITRFASKTDVLFRIYLNFAESLIFATEALNELKTRISRNDFTTHPMIEFQKHFIEVTPSPTGYHVGIGIRNHKTEHQMPLIGEEFPEGTPPLMDLGLNLWLVGFTAKPSDGSAFQDELMRKILENLKLIGSRLRSVQKEIQTHTDFLMQNMPDLKLVL